MRDSKASRPQRPVADAASQPSSSAKAPRIVRSVKKRKFYWMDRVTRATAAGWEVINEKAVSPDGGGIYRRPRGRRGFPEYAATPILRFDSRLGRAVKDMEPIGEFWLVSDRAKTVLELADPDAFVFLACRVELRDGSAGPRYWLCDVVHVIDALNEAESEAKVRKNDRGEKVYNMIGSEILIFKEDVVGTHHIFRMQYRESTVICDDTVKDACKAAGLEGWRYRDTSRHPF
jgi:Protein of unknown function (DUF1629)